MDQEMQLNFTVIVFLHSSSGKFTLSCNDLNLCLRSLSCFMMVSCLAYSSTLKMEVACSFKIPADFQ
jgi:hypothetical protein